MPDRYGDRDDDDWPPRGLASTDDDYDPTPAEIAEFVARAKAALRVPCRFCRAPAGQPCFNAATDKPARKFIAHTVRIADAHPEPVPSPRTPLWGDGTPNFDYDEELF